MEASEEKALQNLKDVPRNKADKAIKHELSVAETMCLDVGTQSTIGVDSQLIGVVGLGRPKAARKDRAIVLQRRSTHWEVRTNIGPLGGEKGQEVLNKLDTVVKEHSPDIVPEKRPKRALLRCFRAYNVDALKDLLAVLRECFGKRALDTEGLVRKLASDMLFRSAKQKAEALGITGII